MKRSEINAIMAQADDMMRSYGFTLPPFAYWPPAEFKANVANARHVIDARCGWDITDYGAGDFDKMGLFLFTLRNGLLVDLKAGGGMCYAEKLLISRQDQLSPMHTHVIKAEDIINRGGATMAIELNGSAPDGSFDPDAGGVVMCDGIARTFSAGEVICEPFTLTRPARMRITCRLMMASFSSISTKTACGMMHTVDF